MPIDKRVSVAAALLGLSLSVTLLSVASPLGLLFGLAAQLTFVVPGVLLVRSISGASAGWLMPVAFGPLTGQALSSLALTGLWAAGGRGLWTIPVAALITSLLIIPARRLAGRWLLPRVASADALALLLLLLIVPLIVGLPFSKVGKPVPGGVAYRSYFTADYVWRRAVVAEIAKGDFLPRNPYYVGDAMHYYWLPHMLSSVEYRAVKGRVDLDQLLLMRSVFIDVFFVALLYGFARLFVGPWAAAAGIAAVTFCSSFEGLCAILVYNRDGVPLSQLRNLNIDAVSRWFYEGMPIDGMPRLLLYQPHHQVGYAMGLLGLSAVGLRSRRSDAGAFGAAGVLLGLSTLVSSFAGLMFTGAAALLEAVSVLRTQEWRRGMVHAVAAAIPLGVTVALVLLFQYVDSAGSVIQFGLNPMSTHQIPWVTFISIGPVILIGAAGAYVAWQHQRDDVLLIAALVVTCIVFYFLIDVRDHQNVYVGWRVGHLLFMTTPVLFAILFDHIKRLDASSRNLAIAAVTAILLAALPTTVIDLYNTQDTDNRNERPGGHWTTVMTPEDLQLFDWLQANTPADAIVQVDPRARDNETWYYLPAFAERRMAVGLPLSMVPLAKYEQGSQRMQDLYNADARTAYDTLVRNHVEYVIVGDPERKAHPDAEKNFDSIPTLMPLVLRNAHISVYKVIPEI
jgi:hypothetical protein